MSADTQIYRHGNSKVILDQLATRFTRGRLVKRDQWVYQHHEELSVDEEELLWNTELYHFQKHCIQQRVRAIYPHYPFFLCLRGGREHWGLKLLQFKIGDKRNANGEVSSYVVYTECDSKNRSGSYR